MAIAKSDRFLLDGYNLACALKSFAPSSSREEIDATVLCSTFRQYETGFMSAELAAEGKFASDSVNLDEIHDVLSAAFAAGTAKIVTAGIGLYALGIDAILMDACTVKYDIPMPVGGLIQSNANFRSTNGMAFGKFLLSQQIDAGTVTGTSIDNTAATTNGGLFHVHWENTDATGISVKVQHSTDNSVWVDLAEVLSGTRASGSYTFGVNPSDTDTIDFNGVTFTFITGSSTSTDIQIKGTLALTMIEAAAVLNASVDADVSVATYTATSTGITVSYDAPGTGGNAYTLDTPTAGNVTRSGAVLSGGADAAASEHNAGSATMASGTTVRRYIRAVATVSGGDTVLVSAAFARR